MPGNYGGQARLKGKFDDGIVQYFQLI